MNITFTEPELQDMQELFNTLDPEDVLFMSHYQLAEATGVPADQWKTFITHPAVSMWLSQELQLFKDFQLKQMIRSANSNDKSVGAAQMINALTKTLNEDRVKDGPIIIYTHVPLTEEQKAGTTVENIELDKDVLAMLPDNWRTNND